jgi:hypothetical protein
MGRIRPSSRSSPTVRSERRPSAAYDELYTIRKTNIDSFLSESSRSEFSYRLIIATTDRVGANARRRRRSSPSVVFG